MRVGLVACARRKGPRPAPARRLYTSPLFRAAAGYCERAYDRWYVLSARHGLVEPGQVLAPYDLTLSALSTGERLGWAAEVVYALRAAGVADACLYLHAGGHYRAALEQWGRRSGDLLRLHAPLAGLGIGQQLTWYRDQLLGGEPGEAA